MSATEVYRVVGAARLSEIITRERAKDPGCKIELLDEGDCEYRITVTASVDKDGGEAGGKDDECPTSSGAQG